jgi:hypothetical protein
MMQFRGRFAKNLAGITVIAFLLSACQTTAVYTSDVLKRSDEKARILIMPMDVELSEVSLGGVATIRADWTEAAQTHLKNSLDDFLAERNAEIVFYTPPDETSEFREDDEQLVKLFSAVANAISVHHYVPGFALPSKNQQFDWTMGDTIDNMSERYDADYALFITVKDSYATAERAAAIVVTALLFGVALQGGIQQGAAALVDLHTGEFAWFNQLARGAGDIRTEKPAKETMTSLMLEFPK